MKLSVVLLLLGTLAFVAAEIKPRFPPTQPVTVGGGNGGTVNGRVLPCDFDYYRIETFDNVEVRDWFRIQFTQTPQANGDFGKFYLVHSEFENLESELNDNDNIVDTLGELPGPDNFDYVCEGAACTIELSCELQDGTYYIAVTGGESSITAYTFSLTSGSANVTTLRNAEPIVALDRLRDLSSPVARVKEYAFYSINVPTSAKVEGAYLLVNISRVSTPGTVVRLHYENLPVAAEDSGILDSGDGTCVYDGCVDTSAGFGEPIYDYPVNTQPRIPCACSTFEQIVGAGRQLTCNVTVDPCQMLYGTWYISVELPARVNNNDNTNLDYTLYAVIVQPFTTTLIRNTTYKGFVAPESQTHYKLEVPASEVVAGDSHLIVQVDNVRNGFVDIWVHKGESDQVDPRAGGVEACHVANATCRTDDACNVVVERCHFGPGTWYVSVSIPYVDDEGFLVDDYDRLPITYTIRATWVEDAVPTRLIAGVPVHKYIGEALYDFYVIEVPPTIDTWLFVELYAQQEDTEVILSMLHGSLPGGECYDRPDFYCLTGDTRGLKIETGPPFPGFSRPLARESCTFMIQTCELEQGPLYLSVYGHRVGYTAYGDTTYYQVPVHYTLYADFDVALSVQSAVSYSENVFERQYNHYYIRADDAVQGQYLSVELTNIQHGVPQTLEAFVNYNFLAGNCPCYDHLYNCTGAVAPSCGNAVPSTEPNFIPHPEVVHTCCTILVPACDFRSGVWYISVLGVNEDLVQYTTPIGYTLTATIHDAPVIKPLIPGQLVPDEVTQWNRTNQYTHYKIGAKPIPNHDLVIKVTYAQNCEFLPKHDNLRDTIDVFVNRGGVAGDRCFDYRGKANIVGTSYETIVIPACEWTDDDYFVAVQGNFDAVFPGRYTISANVVEISDTQLTSGVSVYGRATHARYQHFFIEVPAGITNTDLLIELYTNSDQDSVTAFLNKDYRAGEDQCYEYLEGFRCETESSCSWQIQACQLEAGRYYISVYGDVHQFYDIAVEFTLTATLVNTVTALGADQPYTAHIQAGHIQHYSLTVEEAKVGDYITLLVDNVKHGKVQVYLNYNDLAGLCPCYDFIYSCSAFDQATKDWCEITVPSCDFADGIYYFSVVGVENTTPEPPLYETPIGYTIEIDYITPSFVNPDVVRDRFTANTETFQLISNERYNHYRVDVSQADYDAGYQVIVEITNVRDGALNVYWSDEEPAHNVDSCQVAQICTAGLGAGAECHWQIPYCLSGAGRHYVTVEGITGRNQGSYDILIWLQRPANLASNPTFTLDNAASTFSFSAASSVAISHNKTNEPNGWVQFIRLDNVALNDAEDGDILEVFFYNVRNNIDASVAFDVYLWPEAPAGSGSCCSDLFTPATPERIGNCVDQECLRTVPLTTYNPGNIGTAGVAGTQPTRGAPGTRQDRFNNNRCLDGVEGSGPVPTGANSPFFGERCTVRVWACDAAAAASGTTNWWLTVVPVSPPNPALTPLNGLSYNVQWRVRNTRTLGTGNNAAGTTDLTSAINSANTNTFTITSSTSESEAFASFSIDVDPKGETITAHRIVVQTEFLSGSGVVYIRAESFANPLDCFEYRCTSDEDCDGLDRFIATECCDETVTKYYITVRNFGGDESQLSFRFRISEIDQPEVSKVNLPFNITVASGANALRGEQYDFYSFTLSNSDFADGNSLIVDLTKTNNAGSPIQVFLQYGEIAGAFDGVANDKYPTAEGCYNSELSCTLTDVNAHCYLEQPHCQLLAGTYFVSVYNPTPDFTGALTNNAGFLSYTLGVALTADPTVLTLGTTATGSFNAQDIRYFQYKLDVPASALETTNNGNTGFLTNILRIQTTSNNGNVDLFVNFDFIAADPNDLQCGDFIASDAACQTGGCLIDFIPCDGSFTLKAGTYYIGIRVNAPSTWSITANVVSELYPLLTSTTQTGVQHREGTTNEIYTTRGNQGTAVDGYFRYAITIPGDFTSGRDYLVFNLTSTQTGAISGPINARIWRQDCQIWTCSVTTASSWCVIDAIGLAPCSARTGTYFIRIENPSNAGFVLNAYHNETTVQEIINDQTITEITYPNEYQAYYYEATTIGKDASTLTVTIATTCGAVEAFIQKDTIGGPSSDDGECAISSCVTAPVDGTDNVFTCTLFLDVCTFEQRGYYITVRGTQQTFPNTDNSNLYLPIRYSINVHQTEITTIPVASYCFNVVERITESDDLKHSPVQFYYDLENVETGAILQFVFRVPTQVYDGSEVATFTVTYQKPGSYGAGDDCDYERAPLTCAIGDEEGCAITIQPSCVHLEGRYYILADAPRGTEVVVQLWDPSVYILEEHEIVTATINSDIIDDGGILLNFDFPYRPAFQIYRFDFEPKNDEHFFLQVELFDVTQGEASVSVNVGQYPLFSEAAAASCDVTFVGKQSASEGQDALITANYCELGYTDEASGYVPTTLWVIVSGDEQLCELHSIKYSLKLTTHIEPEILDLDEEHCHGVEAGRHNFYHLSPRTSPIPQDSIIVFELTEVSQDAGLVLSLLDNEGFFGTETCSDVLTTVGSEGISIPYVCGHSDLTFSLFDADSDVNYRLAVREKKIVLNELVADKAFVIDEACDSVVRDPVAVYDVFRFDTSTINFDRVSFVSFTIESEFGYDAFVRANRAGAVYCFDVDAVSSTGSNVLYDFGCNGFAREYYVSVVAQGNYTVTAHVEEKIVDLRLGTPANVVVPAGSAAVFRINVTSSEVIPGSRLSVISSGIRYDSLEYFFTYDARAGEFSTPNGVETCADQHYFVDQRTSQGYDYLEVPGCSFYPGVYWLTIRASEASLEAVSSCDDVTLTLSASVISYELDITTVKINATTTNQKVHAIPRDVNTETPFRFYRVDVSDKGTEALGQLSIRNVDGGVVTAYISRLAFPLPPNLWVKGQVTGLSEDGLIRSGVRPHTPIASTSYDSTRNFPSVDLVGVDVDGDLYFFNSEFPENGSFYFIQDLPETEQIVGIDYRARDGIIYGLGSSSRLYKIEYDADVDVFFATVLGTSAFATPLDGDAFGIDFNPVADRLRVTSNTNQNLRINQLTGALAAVDTAVTPTTANPVAVAYTNSVAAPTVTTMYVIDSVTDSLYIQGGLNSSPSPNTGVLNLVGPLGVDTNDIAGFDILPEANVGFATLTSPSAENSGLYLINLETGRATFLGAVDNGGYPITGLAIRPSTAPTTDDILTGCSDFECTSVDGSCSIDLTPCGWGPEPFFIAVAAEEQFSDDIAITYDIVLNGYPKYREIVPNSNVVDSFDGNTASHYFAGITDGQQSIRFRTEVINGDGVLVTVRNHQCPDRATWVREVYCSGRFYDNKFQCDIDVSTRAHHPGSLTTTFFATVTGTNATFSISFFAGRQNCHDFSGTGSREGLNFCSGLVPYSTYRWENYEKRDESARCLFNELYDHFRVQPCWSGVTPECNSTLQRFACYENFHRCDADGFAVGTCRKACEAVVFECVNWFESVDLEHYNCTSSRYIDSNHACTGHLENEIYDEDNFLDNPLDIIYQEDLPREKDSASSLSASFALVFFAVVAAFLGLF